jgi:putative ABC transport system substrate-binding protein
LRRFVFWKPQSARERFQRRAPLIAYGIDNYDLQRHLAMQVDRVLRGAKPETLPIEQPTKMHLVINLKTARTLRLEIPASVLARADEVIE